jgi:hypothetical protein
MAAANASARGQRAAILASPLSELTGFYLAVDCLTPRCSGERTFAVAELASFYGAQRTVGEVLPDAMLRRLRWPCRGRLAGDRTNTQHSRQQTSPSGAAGAGGAGMSAPQHRPSSFRLIAIAMLALGWKGGGHIVCNGPIIDMQ